MMKKRISLKNRLLIAFTAAVLLPLVVLGLFSYLAAKDQVEENVLDSAQQAVHLINKVVEEKFAAQVQNSAIFAEKFTSETLKNEPAVLSELELYKKQYPDVMNVYRTLPGCGIQCHSRFHCKGYE